MVSPTVSTTAATVGGGFLGGIIIGYALKKVIKILAVIVGSFMAALAYLQYHQIADINWDKLQVMSGGIVSTLTNATTQLPIVTGNSNNTSADIVMTNLGIPLTGSMAMGFAIGFMKG